ncbi:hypothetical protein [Corynebacterium jeikeium]|uniref:hypothetical protein n=1 Tax=Corynebacterium jeikeium TaxID=38289 RepID=UPI000A777505|nr:hypothetical protein [Corynebacterium jeikeium]
MKRVAASVFLIFFGFALTACGSEGDEPVLTGAFAETEELSTSDGAVDNSGSAGAEGDGRVLKPEGHKGMWFETEPTDPWEHYVWASQKFVGDPIELPKLEGKGPDDPLAGLPDVCNEKVIERMEEVGFEHEHTNSEGLVRSCYFFESEGVRGPFSEEMFNVSIDPTRSLKDSKKSVDYQLARNDVSLVGIDPGEDGDDCGIAKKEGSSIIYARLVSGNDPGDVRLVCNLSENFFQILDNLVTY